MQRFDGKVALVTGAGSGIGQATAIRLAAEGARVSCVDISQAGSEATVATIRQAGGEAQAHACDVGSEAAVKACVAACVAHWGRLDVLCNMAGILRFDNAHELALAQWQHILTVNLTGTFLMCREALPHLLATQGNIVNAASTASLAGLPWGAAYAASKGGVLSMTKSLAVEYAKRGVRANCVCPGDIATNMAAKVTFPKDADLALLGRITSLTGMKGPEVVAGVIAMLASQDGIHITGEYIRMDGGTLS